MSPLWFAKLRSLRSTKVAFRRNSTASHKRTLDFIPRLELLENRNLLTITLSVSNPTPLEKGTSGRANEMFVVTRSGDTTASVQVNYTTVDGTAKAGTDYTAESGKLTFASGVTMQTVAVPILGNTIFNSSSLTFTLAPSGARNPVAALSP